MRREIRQKLFTGVRPMMRLRGCALGLMWVAFATAPAMSAATETGILREMEALTEDHEAPAAEKYEAVAASWRSRLGARIEDLHAMSDGELQEAFIATDMALFWALAAQAADVSDWVDLLAELHQVFRQRGLDDAEQAQALFEHLVTLRRFDDAADVKDASVALADRAVPIVHFALGFDDAKPAAMVLRNDGEWDVENVDMTGMSTVVLVGCPMSAKAVAELNAAPGLMKRLEEAGVIWLSDAAALSMEGLVPWWNAEFPAQPIRVAWRNSAWADIDFGSMPKFHLLRDGRVIDVHEGWGDASPSQLLAWLDGMVELEPTHLR